MKNLFNVMFNDSLIGMAFVSDNGNMMKVNKSLCDMTGYTEDELVGLRYHDITHPDDLQEDVNLANELLEKKAGSYTLKKRYIRKDGSVFWGRLTVSYFLNKSKEFESFFLSQIENIDSEQKLLEKLRKQNNAFEFASKGAKIGLWSWIEGEDIEWSDLYSIDKNEFSGTYDSFSELVHPDDVDGLNAEFSKCQNLKSDFNYMFRVFKKELSDYIWIEAKASHTKNNDGKWVVSGYNKDVTAHIKTINELTQSNKSLEEFAYIASHDLKEPLRSISNFLNLLVDKGFIDLSDPKAKSYTDFCLNGCDKLRNLIDSLLEYSRLSTHKNGFVKVNTYELIRSVMSLFSYKITNTQTEVSVKRLPKEIRIIKSQFNILLMNLFSNSIKYRDPKKKNKIKISYLSTDTDTYHLFCFEDNGIGIKAEFLDQVFIIFRRLHSDSEYEGTGVGLTSCKKVIDNHNGEIWIESEYGIGTKVYFKFPK